MLSRRMLLRHTDVSAVGRGVRESRGQSRSECLLATARAARADGRYVLAVLDLHRARRFPEIPQRWLKRDLAALLYSTMDLGFSHRHWLRFVRLYTGRPLRSLTPRERAFWFAVVRRAEALYQQGLRKGLVRNRYQHTSQHLLAQPARSGA